MSSPNLRWKSDQMPGKDPAIVAFRRSSEISSQTMQATITTGAGVTVPSTVSPHHHQNNAVTSPHTNNISGNNNTKNYVQRENGVIEKLLHSYGFIQCCDRQARLFFHYSEINGNIETIKIGDMVEFQQSSDRRTGKPIAVSIVKVPNSNTVEIISDKAVTGLVLAEATSSKNIGSDGEAPSLRDGMGRVAYEQSGETFFLPFALEDIESNQPILTGDQVEFNISTDEKNGNIRARHVRRSLPATVEHFQGVVCSLKDNYGFIERADVVKEIFFHYSEFQGDIQKLSLGDDVEFSIQTRNNKEVAVNIRQLALGTVVFEDVAVEKRRGKILKTLKSPQGRRQSDPLAGRIVYETLKGPIEIPFGDKDQLGDYTMQPTDIVEFYIATDRRDQLQRATNIVLVEDTFLISGEKREKGIVTTLKEGYGFIRCADRDARMFFHFSEMLDLEREINLQDEVEFTIIPDPTSPSRQVAVRIKYLPKGTITLEQYLPEKYFGTVEKEAASQKNPGKGGEGDPGIIMYDFNGTKQTILYVSKTIEGSAPKLSDTVEFQICECRKNNTKSAVNVRVSGRAKEQGFIVTLKDTFGFIEMADHDKEVFFHYNFYEGDSADLDIGDEVEFTLSHKTAKVSAENIRKLKKGTVAPEEILPGVLEGKVTRMLRIVNPDQAEYSGLIQVGEKDIYPYGITSLTDKRDMPQKGDMVKFQVSVVVGSGQRRVARAAPVKRYIHSKVDSLKSSIGYLSQETDDGKKTSFKLSDVIDGAELAPGDDVEFILVQNSRTGKFSAYNVRKLGDRPRPERLISRLKSVGDELGPKVIAVRQPRGPDGTNGFKQPRQPSKPS